MNNSYPHHEHRITHTGMLLRYTHERPDSQHLMAKGEKYDERKKQWVLHPIGIGYYRERSFACSPERAREIITAAAEGVGA